MADIFSKVKLDQLPDQPDSIFANIDLSTLPDQPKGAPAFDFRGVGGISQPEFARAFTRQLFSKSLPRGIFRVLPQQLANALEITERLGTKINPVTNLLSQIPAVQNLRQGIREQIGTPGEGLVNLANLVPTPEPEPELQQIEGFEDLVDPKKLANVIGEQGPAMVANMGAVIANPAFGTALIFAIEGGESLSNLDEVEKQTGRKLGENEKLLLASSVGGFNAALEKLGIDVILGRIPGAKSALARVILAPTTEAVTEGLQEVSQLVAEKTGKHDFAITPEDGQRIAASMYGGGVLGLLGGAAALPFDPAKPAQTEPAETAAEAPTEQAQPQQDPFEGVRVEDLPDDGQQTEQPEPEPTETPTQPEQPKEPGEQPPAGQKTAQEPVKEETRGVTPQEGTISQERPTQQAQQQAIEEEPAPEPTPQELPQPKTVKEFKQQKRQAKRKRATRKAKPERRAKNAQDYIRKSGLRIKTDDLKRFGFGDGTRENRTLFMRVGAKDGVSADEAALQALRDEVIEAPPPGWNLTDWFMEHIRNNTVTPEQRIDDLEQQYADFIENEYGEDHQFDTPIDPVEAATNIDKAFDFNLFEPNLSNADLLAYADLHIDRLKAEIEGGKSLSKQVSLPTPAQLSNFVKRAQRLDPTLFHPLPSPFSLETAVSVLEKIKRRVAQSKKDQLSSGVSQKTIKDNIRTIQDEISKADTRPVVAALLSDGTVIQDNTAANHGDLIVKQDIDPDQVDDTGWVVNGKYLSYYKQTDELQQINNRIKKSAEKAPETRAQNPLDKKRQILREAQNLKESDFLKQSEYNKRVRETYFKDGERIASSRTTPQKDLKISVGQWRIEDTLTGIHGRDIEQLNLVNPEDFIPSEDTTPDRIADVERYREWIREGLPIPPIEVVETDKGKLKITDGHRRWLAAKAENVDVPAWISFAVNVPGKLDPQGNPIKTGLTFEMATQPETLEDVAEALRKGAKAVKGKAEQEFAEAEAKQGRKARKGLSREERRRRFREKVERGEVDDLFTNAAKERQGNLFDETGGEKGKEATDPRPGDLFDTSQEAGEHQSRVKEEIIDEQIEAAEHPAEDPQKGTPPPPPGVNADVGGYALTDNSVLDMPEIVELAQRLLGGKFPRIKKIIGRRKSVLGVFKYKGSFGEIELLAEMFENPEIAKRVLAHEIGHLVDWLPDKTLSRGNILGRIASLRKFMKRYLAEFPGARAQPITAEDRARLKKEAKELGKQKVTVTEEITEEIEIGEGGKLKPEDILAIWNDATARIKDPDLLKYIQGLDGKQKAQAVKAAMKGFIPEWFKFQRKGKTKKVTRTITREVYRTSPEDVKEIFESLLREEIRKRRLFDWETINNELRRLTMVWKPFDPALDPKFTKYRFSSRELYADAFSVLVNAPRLAQHTAPTFYRAFFNWFGKKSEVQSIWDELQQRLQGPRDTLLRQRQERLRTGFENAKLVNQPIRETLREKAQALRDEAARRLVDVNHDIVKRVKAAQAAGHDVDPADNPQYWVEELPYVSSQVNQYLRDIDKLVIQTAEKHGLTVDDLGELMFLKRVQAEREEGGRATLANPLGFTPKDALENMGYLKRQLGEQKYNALLDLLEQFHQLRQDHVINFMEEGKMHSPELLELVKNSVDYYATFDVFHHRLEKQFGRGIASHIYKQIGTFAEVNNPFVATIMKDAAIVRSLNRKMAAEKLEKFMRETGEHIPAEMQFNGRAQVPVEPKDPDLAMVAYLHNGKLKGFYVPKHMGKSFQFDPYETSLVLRVWQAMTRPFKDLFVGKNIPWSIWNLQRDVRGFLTRIPEANLVKFIPHLSSTVKEAARDAFRNESSEFVAEMYRSKELLTGRVFQSKDAEPASELDDMLRSFGLRNRRYKSQVLNRSQAIWDFLDKPGKFTERWIKIAGKKFLLAHTDLPAKEISHLLRTQVGSPDFYRRGSAYRLYNNLFLFSNAGKEGWRSTFEATQRQSKALFAWKIIKYDLLPKTFMYSAAIGLLGAAFKEWMEKIPEHDKINYLTIPFDETEDGKVIYFVLPHDFTGQVLAGLYWKFLTTRSFEDIQQIADYTAGGLPYQGLNPVAQTGLDLLSFAKGRNPVDSWRGEHIIGKKEFEARDHRALIQLLKHQYNSLGGWAIAPLNRYGTEAEAKSEIEKALKIPLVGPTLRRFVRVSDRGLQEKLLKPVRRRRKEAARLSLDVDGRISEAIQNEDNPTREKSNALYRQLKADGLFELTKTTPGQFYKRYLAQAIFKDNQGLKKALRQAKSNAEAEIILETYFDRDIEPNEVKQFKKQILEGKNN